MAGVCESVYEETPYNNVEDCTQASEQVKETAQEMFPYSSGQVWCLSQDEFEKYKIALGETSNT